MHVEVDDAVSALMVAVDDPLVVVTTAANDERSGCVVGFQSQCGIEPIRFAVWLSKANHTYGVALFATHLALHLLNDGDHDLAELFGGPTGDDIDKFAAVDWTNGPGDVPVLVRCPNRVVLQRTALWDDGGDHVCFIGTPVDARCDDDVRPLRMSAVRDIVAGHPARDGGAADHIKALEDIAAGAGHPVDLTGET